MKNCIASMEEFIELKGETEGRVRDRVLESFRPEIIEFKELLGDYISHCLRTSSISVVEITYTKAIEIASEEKYLPCELLEFYRKVSKIKSKYSSTYRQPSIEDLLKFYIDNRENYNTTINYIKNYLRECRSKEVTTMEHSNQCITKLEF